MEHCASVFIQQQIDDAAVATRASHQKWPLVKGAVSLPSGVYHLCQPVRLRSGVAISGASQASTVLVSHLPDDQPVFTSDPDEELYAVSLRRIHAVGSAPGHGVFLRVWNANRNCVFDNLFIENFRAGIFGTNCYTTAFRDIGIYGCISGMVFENLTNGRLHAIKVENCAGIGLRLSASETNTSAGTEICGFVAQGNGQFGVCIDSVDQVHFASLFLEGNNRPSMRAEGDSGEYAQLTAIASRDRVHRRNGNILIDGLFVTPGWSAMNGTVAVDLRCAENILIRGGYIRTFEGKFGMGLQIGADVNCCTLEAFTLQGFKSTNVLRNLGARRLVVNNLLWPNSKCADPYRQFDPTPS